MVEAIAEIVFRFIFIGVLKCTIDPPVTILDSLVSWWQYGLA